MTASDGSTAAWWSTLEQHLAERDREADVPDPWGDAVLDVPALTDHQTDFLAGLGDQPAPPRVGGAPGTAPVDPGTKDETGNSPGDSPGDPGVPSSP